MEISLGSFFLLIVALAAVSVECGKLDVQRGAPSSPHICPCSTRKHAHSKTDRPDDSAHTPDLPKEYLRQSDPPRTTSQQVTDFLANEKCECDCHQPITETTSTKNVATATEATVAPTADFPTTTNMPTSDMQDSTITYDADPTTTVVSSAYSYNRTCTDTECLVVVSHPNKNDVVLKYSCIPPSKCPKHSKVQSTNDNEEEKINREEQPAHSDNISGGAQGSSTKTDGNNHGSSSDIVAQHAQTSSGHTTYNRGHQTQSAFGLIMGGDQAHSSSSHSTAGDHSYSSTSHNTIGDRTHSSSQSTIGNSVSYSSTGMADSHSKGQGSKQSYAFLPDMGGGAKPTNAGMGGGAKPTNAGMGGGAKPTNAGMGGGAKPTYAGVVRGAKPTYAGVVGGAKPTNAGMGGGGGHKYSPVALSFIYQEPVPTTLRTTTTTGPPAPMEQQSNNILTPPNCGVVTNPKLLSRITGGRPAERDKWPWVVAYGYEAPVATWSRQQVSWLCAGALVTAKCSITAAHCLDHPSMKLKHARFGDLDLEDDEDGAHPDTKEVHHGIKHPLYKMGEFNHDIAIVVLKTALRFGSTIAPICLPFGDSTRNEKFIGMEPYIAGWGHLEFKVEDNSMLYEAQVPVVSNEDCAQIYGEKLNRIVRSNHICAGGNGTDTCQGDSGGTLMVPWEQHFYTIGVVSWGFRCGAIGYPGVYTRITSYLDWLQQNLT